MKVRGASSMVNQSSISRMHYLAAMSKLSAEKKYIFFKFTNINHLKQTSKLHFWFDCIFFYSLHLVQGTILSRQSIHFHALINNVQISYTINSSQCF